jgi:acid phosphatase type 7
LKGKVMAKKNSTQPHRFGRSRPSEGKPALHKKPERNTQFRPLPDPTGTLPFQLDLASILSANAMKAITKARKLTFHLDGDLGGIGQPMQQMLVAQGLEADFRSDADPSENPAFLYVVGDCVYFNGEKTQYYAQFYHPYEYYPAPILAVPGNHDGENLPQDNSLDGFIYNFCAKDPEKRPESQDAPRTAMVQPNVYWTLLTPVVNIIGVYSNVPEGGDVRPPQTDWLAGQLRTLPRNKPVFVALHHPIYSADTFHSGSTFMKELLQEASTAAGRSPEMVLTGHVHNYQRITHAQSDGTLTVHLVTGAGGYPHLHSIIKVDGERMVTPARFDDKEGDNATVEKYSDDHHGFMRLEVTGQTITGRYYEVPRPHEPYSKGSQLFDYFEFDWRNRRYLPNKP